MNLVRHVQGVNEWIVMVNVWPHNTFEITIYWILVLAFVASSLISFHFRGCYLLIFFRLQNILHMHNEQTSRWRGRSDRNESLESYVWCSFWVKRCQCVWKKSKTLIKKKEKKRGTIWDNVGFLMLLLSNNFCFSLFLFLSSQDDHPELPESDHGSLPCENMPDLQRGKGPGFPVLCCCCLGSSSGVQVCISRNIQRNDTIHMT